MTEEKNTAALRHTKRRMMIAAAIILLLGALSWLLLQNPDLFTLKSSQKETSMYSDRLLSYSFYPTDYELDVTADETYMGLDRYIHIQRGAENFAITDGDYAAWGETAVFFAKYFEAAVTGDAEAYNTLFTENYYKSAKPYDRFAPQMIYGIKIEELSVTQGTAGTSYICNVTYAIHRNDGSFRNDIDSNAYKTLIFYLVPDGGELKIDAIDYYRSAK